MMKASGTPSSPKNGDLASFGMMEKRDNPIRSILPRVEPYYATTYGAAYLGDAGELLPQLESESIQLIMTSPPYALIRKKPYGNVEQERYVEWFMEFADELSRVLTSVGSLVIDIGGSWQNGSPVKSTYQFEAVS